MGTYATNADVTRNIPARPIGTTSAPSTASIDEWITQAEAHLTGALDRGGVSVPITDASGVEIMKSWAVLYAEGHTRMALAAGAGDGTNDDGKDLIERFFQVVEDIISDPSGVEAMLSGGSSSDTTRKLKSYVIDNDDGLSVSNGDFAPVFDRNEVL